jgi:hypothetical protein
MYHVECFDIWPRTFGASLCTVEFLSGSTIQYSFGNFKIPPMTAIYLPFLIFKTLFALHFFYFFPPLPCDTSQSHPVNVCLRSHSPPHPAVGLSHPPTRLINRKVMESLNQLIPDAIILSFRQTKIKTSSLVHVVPQSRKLLQKNCTYVNDFTFDNMEAPSMWMKIQTYCSCSMISIVTFSLYVNTLNTITN